MIVKIEHLKKKLSHIMQLDGQYSILYKHKSVRLVF